jgi:predicted transcriptional regulator
MARTNDDEERLSNLHFLLSNADRRSIIEELQVHELKLSEVAKRLGITATEAFRQLQRLTDSDFLEKTAEGKYRSTNYSKLMLESSAGMDFISNHRKFFLDHDTSLIPPEFRARFGELSNAILHTESVPNINTGTEVLKSAEKWVDVMSDQRLEQHGQLLRQRSLDEGIKVRTLMQESLLERIKGELIIANSGEIRYIPRVCATMINTDKIVGFALPRLDGKMDYQVFAGTDARTTKWVTDLFEDQWNKAKPWHQ